MGANLIGQGDVDERSITEVQVDDIKGYNNHHFFSGIAGWACALRYAEWPPERSVWTGSPPCQPYSKLGEEGGFDDERDLCPYWIKLLSEHAANHGRPTVFGEQVDEAIDHGWVDRLADDLGNCGYALWPVVLPSAAAGGGDQRERLFFVGDPDPQGLEGHTGNVGEIIQRAIQDGHVATTSLCHRPQWVAGWDGLKRPGKPGTSLLADGFSPRMVRTYSEGFGNAINPRIAAELITAFMECRP